MGNLVGGKTSEVKGGKKGKGANVEFEMYNRFL